MNNVKFLANIVLTTVALGTAHHVTKPPGRPASVNSFLSTEGRSHRVSRPRTAQKYQASRSRSLTYTVTATAYQAVTGQTDDEPFVTADNSRIKPHYTSKTRWLAISRDLLAQGGGQFEYGDKVRVRGLSPQLDGVYTVHDTMNKRHRHCIDILTHVSEKLDLFNPGVKIKLVARRTKKNSPPAQEPTRNVAATAREPKRGHRRSDPRLASSPLLRSQRPNYLASVIL